LQLFVFTFLYTVMGVACVGDITFDPDNSFSPEWEAHHFGKLVKLYCPTCVN